jgi:hypothetical protein
MTAPAACTDDEHADACAPQGALRAVPRLPDDDLATAPVWWARLAHRDARPVEHSLVAVGSARFRHGSAVDLSAVDPRGGRPTGWLVDVRYRAADGRIVRLEASPGLAGSGLPLWFAEIAHATSDIPSVSLLAFRGDDFPAGTLVTPSEVSARGLTMTENVGELRWWTRSGLIESVTVAPDLAGRGVDRLLTGLAGGIAMQRNWPPLGRSLPPQAGHEIRRGG